MEKKRPIVITIICIFWLISAAVTIPSIFSPIARSRGPWFLLSFAASLAIVLVCMIGLWRMKKWGIIVYTVFTAVNQVVLLAMGTWHLSALLIPVVIIAVAFSQFSKMD